METWQKAHIQKNLIRLIQTTICSTELIAHLQVADLLADEEVKILKNENTTPISKTVYLYEIMCARRNSYGAFIDVLKSTRQYEASDILEKPEVRYRNVRSIKYDKNNVIGIGSFGTIVYGGEFGGRDVAVKMLSTKFCDPVIAQNDLNLLLKMNFHPNVVRYYAAEADTDFFCIAMQCSAISLQDEVTMKLINLEDVVILRKCTEGLNHLHGYNVVHGNLKPANVLLKANKEVKISDFGMSKIIPDGLSDIVTTCVSGTLDWMAPEVLRCIIADGATSYSANTSFRTDVFALGCIYYFTLSQGNHPFGDSYVSIPSNICNNKPNLKMSEKNKDWLSLMMQMISNDPFKRPATDEILSHQLFSLTRNNLHEPVNGGTSKLVAAETSKQFKESYTTMLDANNNYEEVLEIPRNRISLSKVSLKKVRFVQENESHSPKFNSRGSDASELVPIKLYSPQGEEWAYPALPPRNQSMLFNNKFPLPTSQSIYDNAP